MNESSKRRIGNLNSRNGGSPKQGQLSETSAQVLVRLLNEVVPDSGPHRKRTYFDVIYLRLWSATTTSKNGNAALKIMEKYEKLAPKPKPQFQNLLVEFTDELSEAYR